MDGLYEDQLVDRFKCARGRRQDQQRNGYKAADPCYNGQEM